MKKFHYLDSIISPSITEKSTMLSEQNKVVFKASFPTFRALFQITINIRILI